MDEEDKIQRYEPTSRSLERPTPAQLIRYETVEMEEERDLFAYWRVIRKRRWTVLTTFSVVFVLVLIGTLNQTPKYRAKALLEIRKENPNILTVQELFELESVSDTYLETQYRILQSDSLARRVIKELRLDRVREFARPKARWSFGGDETSAEEASKRQIFAVQKAEEQDEERLQRILEGFKDRLAVSPVKRSRLVQISFESEAPDLAARVVNTLVGNYVEQELEARWEATQRATEWLSQQLIGLKVRLEKSEEELQQYARAHGLLFLEREEGGAENIINQRLLNLQEELTRAQAMRFEKESLFRLVEARNYGALPGVGDNRLMQDLTLRLAELRRESAQLATTFTREYFRVKQIQNQIDELESVLTRERERASERIANEYRAAVQRENLLRQALEEQREQANLIAEKSVQYNILKREVETNKQLYEGLLQRLKEAGVSAGLKATNIRIVDPAEPPERPARPKLLFNLALAVVFGLGLGVGIAFLQEYMDNTLKTSEDVERFLRVPALALIPSLESLNGRRGTYGLYGRSRKLLEKGQEKWSPAPQRGGGTLIRIDRDPEHSVLGEAFRSLRTSVLLSTAEHPPKTLLISSSRPAEGKTTISINLAISLAQLGERVLLIEGDMRRPCIYRTFELRPTAGLASYLVGQLDWRSAIQITALRGLDVMCCGTIPPNPAELLSSGRMRELILEARHEYAFVVLDSPPLLSVADSRILATLVDAVVLVVQGGMTPRELTQRAQTYMRDVGGNVIGVVLNNLDVRTDDYYYYRYYGYHSEGPRDSKN